MTGAEDLLDLGASLAIGLLIGIERGWHQRALAAGSRTAGVRTFALVGLLGGLGARVGRDLGPLLPAVAFAAVAALVVSSYVLRVRRGGPNDATTEVAALITFVLGAGPPLGFGVPAAAAAVVTAGLLSTKRRIHLAVAGIEERELFAGLQLLAIAFLVLPLLPDRGVGPWEALNLRSMAWLVLLLGGLSFVGYAAVKRAGARVGLALSAVLGGLVSSTAVTLDFSRRARSQAPFTPLLGAGIVGAGGTMFLRVTALTAVVAPDLLVRVAPVLGAMALTCWIQAALAWRRARRELTADTAETLVRVANPLALGLALKFALLLAAVSILAAALRAWLGDRGVYLLSLAAGLGDVDALTLALARQHTQGLPALIAAQGVLIATAVDTCLKSTLACVLGGRALGLRVVRGFLLALLAGAAVLLALNLRW